MIEANDFVMAIKILSIAEHVLNELQNYLIVLLNAYLRVNVIENSSAKQEIYFLV